MKRVESRDVSVAWMLKMMYLMDYKLIRFGKRLDMTPRGVDRPRRDGASEWTRGPVGGQGPRSRTLVVPRLLHSSVATPSVVRGPPPVSAGRNLPLGSGTGHGQRSKEPTPSPTLDPSVGTSSRLSKLLVPSDSGSPAPRVAIPYRA